MMCSFLAAYIGFLWMLLLVAYGRRDPNAFFLNQHIQDSFSREISDSMNLGDVFTWANTSLLNNLFGVYPGKNVSFMKKKKKWLISDHLSKNVSELHCVSVFLFSILKQAVIFQASFIHRFNIARKLLLLFCQSVQLHSWRAGCVLISYCMYLL